MTTHGGGFSKVGSGFPQRVTPSLHLVTPLQANSWINLKLPPQLNSCLLEISKPYLLLAFEASVESPRASHEEPSRPRESRSRESRFKIVAYLIISYPHTKYDYDIYMTLWASHSKKLVLFQSVQVSCRLRVRHCLMSLKYRLSSFS